MLTFVCVKSGDKYGPEYVNILFDMVRRNLPEGTPGKFVCFTENPAGLDIGIETRGFPADISYWWPKLFLFSKDLFPEGDRIIYLDLDVVVMGGLDDLIKYDGDFATLRDPWIHNGWNSSVMCWRAGYGAQVWDEWIALNKPCTEAGDQVWIQTILQRCDILQDLYPDKFLSYKADCKIGTPPRGAWVVYFHGEPKPDNCAEEWVKLIWKIGGGTSAELEMVCNVQDEALKANIRAACGLPVPWLAQYPPNELHAVIVGGSPSATKYINEIRWRQSIGQKIFSLNNSHRWLKERGIEPDYQVILDARPENADFVRLDSPATHFLASQCHPDVFRRANGMKICLFHVPVAVFDEAFHNPELKPECLVSCGTTVGLAAMGIAYALGHRKIHIYGMDSSYSDGQHHAYAQPGNDGDVVLDVVCAGRSFKVAPWMAAQADQFQTLALELANADCEITVRGDGLIPWIAQQMQFATVPDTEIIERNGVYWPSRDEAMQANVWNSLSHIPPLLSQVEGRAVVVQAGGNVGLWPREFAKHFKRVITFEPDALNFQCLERNLAGISNIERHNAGLSDRFASKALVRQAANCGAHYITEGDEFKTVTIDSLELDACDLIQLDIEGHELFALRGAEKTIAKFHPTICLEINGTSAKLQGYEDQDTLDWLEERGYQAVLKFGRDVVFTNREGVKLCNSRMSEPDTTRVQTAL